jgi:hypothetical protein
MEILPGAGCTNMEFLNAVRSGQALLLLKLNAMHQTLNLLLYYSRLTSNWPKLILRRFSTSGRAQLRMSADTEFRVGQITKARIRVLFLVILEELVRNFTFEIVI